MQTTERSLKKLFERRGWHKNSGINESTARVYKKRFFENRLEMETQMKILEACGFRLIRNMQWEEETDHEQLKTNLLDKLKKENAFWSFDQSFLSQISNDILIEKALLHLDIEEINTLFNLFPKRKIRNISRYGIIVIQFAPFFQYHNCSSREHFRNRG